MNPIIAMVGARKIANGNPNAHTIEMPNKAPPIESGICSHLTEPAIPLHSNNSISNAEIMRVIIGNTNIARLPLLCVFIVVNSNYKGPWVSILIIECSWYMAGISCLFLFLLFLGLYIEIFI